MFQLTETQFTSSLRSMAHHWFERLYGFREGDYDTTKSCFELREGVLVSTMNHREFQIGEFITPTLAELRNSYKEIVPVPKKSKGLTISHVAVNDIYQAHMNPEYAGSMFQVASQFNCLEFISPRVVPEHGITGYASDHTQGPACSLACAAGTVYRNYFAPTPKGQRGQRSDDQLNNLDQLEQLVGNSNYHFWKTRNGYVDSTPYSLSLFNRRLQQKQWNEESLRESVKIGLQLETEVVHSLGNLQSMHLVNQAFCSGISIGYSQASVMDWEPLARIVLDAVYESTILAALIQQAKGRGTNIVMLTFIGGGVFGNRPEWINQSIAKACARYAAHRLDVRVCHYQRVSSTTARAIDSEFLDLK